MMTTILSLLLACVFPIAAYPVFWNRKIRREWNRMRLGQGPLLHEKPVIYSNLLSIQFPKASVKCSGRAIIVKTNSIVWPYFYLKMDDTAQPSSLGSFFAIKRRLEGHEIKGRIVKLLLREEGRTEGRKEVMRIKNLTEGELRLMAKHLEGPAAGKSPVA